MVEIRLYLVPGGLELVVDRRDWKARQLRNLAASVPVEEMQDKVACALGLLLPPHGVGANSAQIILLLHGIACLIRRKCKVNGVKVGKADQV